MTQNRFYSSIYPPTTLAAAITSAGATTISVASITGAPGSFPYTMLIDWGLSTQEAVSVTASSGSGPFSLTVTRGIDGTTAQTHSNGAVVVHGVTAQDYNEPQVHIAASSAVHGLTGTVVGTSDSQTLTNKTLGATSGTGAYTVSAAAAGGALLSVTNTTAAPTAPNSVVYSNTSTDEAFGLRVSGDTKSRLGVTAAGQLKWGPGGSSSSDTNLYRNASGEAKSDNSLTVAGNLTVGGAQLLAGGTGVVGVNNASVAPTSSPSGGAVLYGKSGYIKWRGTDGNDYNTGHFRALLVSPFTTANSASVQNVTGMSVALGVGTYEIDLMAPYVGAGTIGSTGVWAFTFSGTATLAALTGQFRTSAYTAPTYISSITGSFTSPTLTSTTTLFALKGIVTISVAGTLQLTIQNTTAADETTVQAGSFIKASIIA